MHRALCWAARLTAIGAIAFLSSFALDVFEPGMPEADMLPALAVHLAPSLVLVVVLAIAWRRPLVGGVLFVVVAALPLLLLHNPLSVNLLLSAPFFLVGLLFLACFFTSGRDAAP